MEKPTPVLWIPKVYLMYVRNKLIHKHAYGQGPSSRFLNQLSFTQLPPTPVSIPATLASPLRECRAHSELRALHSLISLPKTGVTPSFMVLAPSVFQSFTKTPPQIGLLDHCLKKSYHFIHFPTLFALGQHVLQ